MRDGNDYVLNGTKMFITNGVHGDLCFIAARTDPEAKGSRALTMFIVEKGTPGFKVGRALDKTGWRSSDTAELIFEDCRVPAENVLGEPNRGFYSIMANFQTERLVIGAMAMAEAREAIRHLEHVSHATASQPPVGQRYRPRCRAPGEVEAAADSSCITPPCSCPRPDASPRFDVRRWPATCDAGPLRLRAVPGVRAFVRETEATHGRDARAAIRRGGCHAR